MPYAPHQVFDAVQHAIQIRRQLVEFIAAAAFIDTLAQVASDDALGRVVDVFDTLQYLAAEKRAAGQGQGNDQSHTPGKCGTRETQQAVEIGNLPRDQQNESFRQR